MGLPLKAISSLANSNSQEPVPSTSTDIAQEKPTQSRSSSRSYPKSRLSLSRRRAKKDSSQMSQTQGHAKPAHKDNAAKNDKGTPLVGKKQTEGASLPDQKEESPVRGNDPEPAIVHAGKENAALGGDNDDEGEVGDQNHSDVRPLVGHKQTEGASLPDQKEESPVRGNDPEPAIVHAAKENAALGGHNDDEGEVGDQNHSDVRPLGGDSNRTALLPGRNEQQPPVRGKKKGVGVHRKSNEPDGVALQKEKHVPLPAHKDSSGASPCQKDHTVPADNNGKNDNDAPTSPKQYSVAEGNYHSKSLYCSLSSSFSGD